MSALRWLLRFPWSFVFAVYAGVGGLAVVDGTLARMHPPGGASASATAILSPSTIGSSQAHFVAIQQWQEWVVTFDASKGDRVLSPVGLLVIYLLVDILLVAVPVALLLGKANQYARDRIKASTGVGDAQKRTLVSILDMALWMTVGFVLVDIVEDLSLLGFVAFRSASANVLIGVGLISAAKLIALLMAVIASGVGLLISLRLSQPSPNGFLTILGQWWRVALALRIHIAVAGFLLVMAGLQGDLGRQLDDAFMLLFEQWGRLVVTVAVALFLAVVLRLTGRLCLMSYVDIPSEPGKKQLINWLILVAGAVAVIIGAVAIYRGWVFGQALLVPGAIVVLISLFSLTTVEADETVPAMVMPEVATSGSVQALRGGHVASALAATPIAVLIALSLRNGLRLLTIRNGTGALVVGVVMLVLAVAACLIAYKWTKLAATEPSRRWLPALGLSSVALFGILAWSPQVTGTLLAPWAALFAFAFAMVLGLTALLLLGDSIYPGSALAACGVKRLPVIAIVAVSFLGTSIVDDQSVYHSTRLLPSAEAKPQNRMSFSQALDAWAARQPNKPEIPLVFVASSGGGIRAAYWTTLVLACLVRGNQPFEAPPRLADDKQCRNARMPMESMFLASGISGGSVGLAVTQAIANRNDWWKPLRRDFLGPTIAAFAFRDIPNALLRINVHDQDRAAALERSWETAVQQSGGDLEEGFMAAALPDGKDPAFPMLMLNGTSVTDGCRLSVSPLYLAGPGVVSKTGNDAAETGTRDCLALDPLLPKTADVVLQTLAGTKDGFDNTCRKNEGVDPQDLRLSTAALLSARFPYVSPTGTLNSCQNPNDRTFDLDGGLIDSSGASPLALTWPDVISWIEKRSGGRCFAPKLIFIENGYLSQTKSQPPARPDELSAPLTATGAVRDAQSPEARQAAALDFQKSFPPGGCKTGDAPNSDAWTMPNVVDFYPVARPGVEAPLGWTLSKYSQQSLEQQLGNADNLCSAAIVAAWFTGDTARPAACY
ncbi:MAG TPA: hypothetical protein VJV41_01050 [Mycobacterium sp.]|nr:hypothetical protein [Mycobacterium sp.]